LLLYSILLVFASILEGNLVVLNFFKDNDFYQKPCKKIDIIAERLKGHM
jgi:hypothetical protein